MSSTRKQDIIALEGLEFFAYHGFYDEEQKIGNKYAIDIKVEADVSKAAVQDKLAETVNYEKLFQEIASEMRVSHRLLESVGEQICMRIFKRFAIITAIEISVSKFNPPIGGVCKCAKVTLIRARD